MKSTYYVEQWINVASTNCSSLIISEDLDLSIFSGHTLCWKSFYLFLFYALFSSWKKCGTNWDLKWIWFVNNYTNLFHHVPNHQAGEWMLNPFSPEPVSNILSKVLFPFYFWINSSHLTFSCALHKDKRLKTRKTKSSFVLLLFFLFFYICPYLFATIVFIC